MSDAAWPVTEREVLAQHDGASDAALLAQSVDQPDCFAALFDRHAPTLYRYIARRLGPDAADDLVSEAFLIAFRRRGSFDGSQSDARPWLYGIVTNLIGRHRRDEVRFLRAIARTGTDPAAECFTDRVTDRIAARAVRGQLASALARLPGPQRDTLLLIASGLSHEQVARALGVPTGTVASWLARGRRRLRAALGEGNPASDRGE